MTRRAPTASNDVLWLVDRARALVFDFDGTLVSSNEIKWAAFEACFADRPDRRDEIIAYCRSGPHTPRDVKFRYVYEEILGVPYTEAVGHRLGARFNALTTSAIVAAPEVPGASRFIACAGARRPLALLSSTPHEVLVEILEGRGWKDRFVCVQGGPVDKAAWLTAYREGAGVTGGEVVVFGDTLEDAAAATVAGCGFVAVGADPVLAACPHRIDDFTGLV